MKKCLVVALNIAMLAMVTPKMWADGIGLTVTGVLTLYGAGDTPLQPSKSKPNYLNSASGAVPAGYGNSNTFGTAVIGSGVEFGVTNGEDLLTVDYTGTTVTIKDTCVAVGCGTTPFTLALLNPYITGYSVISNSFPDVSYGYGDTLYTPDGGLGGALTFFGASGFTGATLVASYTSITPPPSPSVTTSSLLTFAALESPAALSDPAPAAVPEPATFGLLSAGLVGIAGLLRKRSI
jgi:hypothetical protein